MLALIKITKHSVLSSCKSVLSVKESRYILTPVPYVNDDLWSFNKTQSSVGGRYRLGGIN